MRRATSAYIAIVVLLAACAVAALYIREPRIAEGSLSAALLLSGLALVAEVLGFLLPQSARGSIAFIPYLALIVLVPGWASVVAVLVVKSITELAAKIPRFKVAFNVAQLVVTLSAAILVYRALGGVSLLTIEPPTLLHVTREAGLAAVVAFTMSYGLNTMLVSIAIAISTRASVFAVWRENKLATVGLDLLVSPTIFVFAWVYSAYGPIAAATLWVPFLGLRQLHKANLELEQTNRELLELMVKSLEARDPYTSGHSRRVQQFSKNIARALGLSSREVEQVSRAALLHDVGKIHEKYAPILSKPDKLDSEEWATMKEHPADGADLVATMTKLRDVVAAIRGHHENWDGTGYPDGVAGELIPLASRIIRFADTIDAMTTERPYRRPLTENEVRAEIVRCRGTQFDPSIADALLSSQLWATLFAAPDLAPNGREGAILAVIGERRKRSPGAGPTRGAREA